MKTMPGRSRHTRRARVGRTSGRSNPPCPSLPHEGGAPEEGSHPMTDQETLPPPLVPAEVDLRDFPYLQLDVVRLRDSDLAAVPDGEVFRAAVLSWCASWHQIPAASLPDDDNVLARILGYGRDVRSWSKLRAAGALRGFVKCSDGRLYHPDIAETATRAIENYKRKLLWFKALKKRRPSPIEWYEIRRRIFQRDDFTCQYCWQRGGALECDHVIPIARKGKNDDDNLKTSCKKCNREKGTKLVSEWVQ